MSPKCSCDDTADHGQPGDVRWSGHSPDISYVIQACKGIFWEPGSSKHVIQPPSTEHVEQIFLPLPAQPQEPLAVPPSLQSDGGNKQMTVPHKLHNCDAWTPRPGHSTIMVITEGHGEWILHLFFVHRWGKVVMADRTHNHRLLRKLQERSWPTAPSSRIHCLQHWFLVILCLPRHYTAT